VLLNNSMKLQIYYFHRPSSESTYTITFIVLCLWQNLFIPFHCDFTSFRSFRLVSCPAAHRQWKCTFSVFPINSDLPEAARLSTNYRSSVCWCNHDHLNENIHSPKESKTRTWNSSPLYIQVSLPYTATTIEFTFITL